MRDGKEVQCILIPEILKAYKLTFGLEDGFINNNFYIEADDKKYDRSFKSNKYPRYSVSDEQLVKQILSEETDIWKPFIRNAHGKLIPLNFGDIVIEQRNGNKYTVSNEKFYSDYKII